MINRLGRVGVPICFFTEWVALMRVKFRFWLGLHALCLTSIKGHPERERQRESCFEPGMRLLESWIEETFLTNITFNPQFAIPQYMLHMLFVKGAAHNLQNTPHSRKSHVYKL